MKQFIKNLFTPKECYFEKGLNLIWNYNSELNRIAALGKDIPMGKLDYYAFYYKTDYRVNPEKNFIESEVTKTVEIGYNYKDLQNGIFNDGQKIVSTENFVVINFDKDNLKIEISFTDYPTIELPVLSEDAMVAINYFFNKIDK